MYDLILKRGDTGTGFKATLSNEKGNVDLTGASVLFLFDGHEIKAGIQDAINGVVNVTFNDIHVQKSGVFMAELQVTFPDGRVETYPSDSYLKIYIMQDLGGI